MKLFNKVKKNPVALAATGTVIGILAAGTLFVYRNSFRNIPVAGAVVDNAANGLNGSNLARPLT